MRRTFAIGVLSSVIALVVSLFGTAPTLADTTDPDAPSSGPGPGETLRVTVHHYAVERPGGKVRERIDMRLGAPADVTVGVHGEAGKLVRGQVELGTLGRGLHSWTWTGHKNDGTSVPDGRYRVYVSATFKRSGALWSWAPLVRVHRRYHPGSVTSTYATIYPRSTVVHDVTTLANRPPVWNRPTLRIRNGAGRVVFARAYRRFRPSLSLKWDGRDSHGRALPAGAYEVTVSGVDKDGFTGTSRPRTVTVSGKRLVLRTRTLRTDPTAYRMLDYPRGCNGCPEYPQCGELVASQRFADPGATSYRSGSGCGTRQGQWVARTQHLFRVTEVAPRGYGDVTVSMFGGPTTPGAADQGTLTVRSGDTFINTPTGADTTDHTVTAAPVPLSTGFDNFDEEYVPGFNWSFSTREGASFDVASFTLKYTFLTPRV